PAPSRRGSDPAPGRRGSGLTRQGAPSASPASGGRARRTWDAETMHERTTPTPPQPSAYLRRTTFPAPMTDWVQRDVTRPGAPPRYLARFLVPILPVLCLFLLLPGPAWMGLSMVALLYLPLIYFTIALMYVYRRHRLIKHGLDPALADADARARG